MLLLNLKFSSKVMASASLIVFLFCLPYLVFSLKTNLLLNVPAVGPESFVFDSTGGGPYTGISDGRVVKYNGSAFIDFSYASPYRTKALCDGTNDPILQHTCGRTIGLAMYHATDTLYMLDSYNGLCAVGPQGGLATPLATEAEGQSFTLLDGIDVDQKTGIVYFTDASALYNLEHIGEQVANRDSTARILQYNPKTKEVTVLLRNLSGAGGVAVSNDSTYLIISEFTGDKVRKYWLEGSLKGMEEIILNVRGPCNVKRTPEGDFWVAVNFMTPNPVPMGMKIDGNGTVVEVVPIETPFDGQLITEVHEFRDLLYVGSMVTPYGAIYKYGGDQSQKSILS